MVKSNIDKKFSAHYDAVEAELKSSTVGKRRLLLPQRSGTAMLTRLWLLQVW